MNTFIGIGTITKDGAKTETRNVKGVPTLVTNFTVAVFTYGKEEPEYINCAIWRDRGARLAQYLTAKRHVMVRGSLTGSAWIDSTGKARYSLELVNPDVELIGQGRAQEQVNPETGEITSELPFAL